MKNARVIYINPIKSSNNNIVKYMQRYQSALSAKIAVKLVI